MATTALEIILKAQDDASKVIAGAAGNIKASFAEAEAASKQAALGMLAVGAAAAGFIGYGAKIAGDLEASHQGFVTLLGSTKAADAAIAQIKKDAFSTPFDLPGLTRMNQQLTAITGNSSTSERILMNFGKAMAAMGHGGEELSGVMVQVNQVLNKGKLEMQDVRPIQSYIDLYGVMSRNLGISKEKLMEMQTAGTLTSDMLLQAFEKASNGSGEFANAYINQAGTFNQLLSNTKDAFGIMAAQIVEKSGAFDVLKNAMSGLINFMSDHQGDILNFVKSGLQWLADYGPIVAGVLIGALVPAFVAFTISVGASVIALAPYLLAGAAVGAIFILIRNNLDLLNQKWQEATSWVMQHRTAIVILLAILAPLPMVIAGMVAVIVQNWQTIVSAFQNAWNQITAGIEWLKGHWLEAIGFILGYFATLPIRIPLYVAQAITAAITYLISVNWSAVGNSILGAFASIFGGVKNVALDAWNYLTHLNWGALFTSIPKSIGNAIIDLINGGIKGAFSGIPILGDHIPSIPHFAAGTSFAPGGLSLVGEKGPELVNLPRGAQVYTNQQSQQMMSSTPSITIGTVINNTQADWSSFSRDIGFQLALRT